LLPIKIAKRQELAFEDSLGQGKLFFLKPKIVPKFIPLLRDTNLSTKLIKTNG
jgi:hypothetical protein